MRKLKVILTAILVVVSAISLTMFAACGPKGPAVTLDKDAVSVKVGETVTVVATLRDEGATATWTSADEAIATVANGVITGITRGETTVTATVGEESATVKVTVTQDAAATMSKDGILSFTAIDGDKTIVINDGAADVETKTATGDTFDAYTAIIDYRVANSITADKAYTVKVTAGDFTKSIETATFRGVGDKAGFRAIVDRENEKEDNFYFYLTADIEFDEETAGYGTGYKTFCSAQNATEATSTWMQVGEAVLNLNGRGYALKVAYVRPGGGDRWMFDHIVDSNIKNLVIDYDVHLYYIKQASFANWIINSTFDNCYISLKTLTTGETQTIKFMSWKISDSTFNDCIFNFNDTAPTAADYPMHLTNEGENQVFNNCAVAYNYQQGADALFAGLVPLEGVDIRTYTTMAELLTAESAKSWPSAWEMSATALKLAGRDCPKAV